MKNVPILKTRGHFLKFPKLPNFSFIMGRGFILFKWAEPNVTDLAHKEFYHLETNERRQISPFLSLSLKNLNLKTSKPQSKNKPCLLWLLLVVSVFVAEPKPAQKWRDQERPNTMLCRTRPTKTRSRR